MLLNGYEGDYIGPLPVICVKLGTYELKLKFVDYKMTGGRISSGESSFFVQLADIVFFFFTKEEELANLHPIRSKAFSPSEAPCKHIFVV